MSNINLSEIIIKIGLEIEFYLHNYEASNFVKFYNYLKNELIDIYDEAGENQYEFEIKYSSDLKNIARKACDTKNKIIYAAKKFSMDADFSAKPHLSKPGNAMQVNISIYKNDQNIFRKVNEDESQFLLYAIGGLCEDMIKSMLIFAPNENDYLRYDGSDFSPSSISWGANNRTTSIRVPTTCDVNRRIEHRVPSANAHPYKVMLQIAKSIIKGIKENISPPQKIFGNANHQQYMLEKLPNSLEETKKLRTMLDNAKYKY